MRDNLQKLKWTFFANGQPIAEGQFFEELTLLNGQACRFLSAKVSGWPVGKTELKVVLTFEKPLNDGYYDYATGAQTWLAVVTREK